MIRIALLMLLALTAPVAARAELSAHDLRYDGLARNFLVYVPKRLGRFDGPRPMVIVLHGGGGGAREVRYSTRRRFEDLADRSGFVVLYPNAIGRLWDTGGGNISAGLTPRRDDAGFIAAAIDAVAAEVPIDRTRIFATGVSRGGMESYALACAHPGMLRAIAPVAMTLPEASLRSCRKGKPVGFLLIHGTADPIVPYAGGPITIRNTERDMVLSADRTIEIFARRNGCDGWQESKPSGTVRRFDAQGCRAPTAFLSVGKGGHGWPGGRKVLPGDRAGPINRDISSPDEIWAFFSRF